MIVAKDAGSVAVGKRYLNRVIADRRGRLRARLGLEHRQCGRRNRARSSESTLSYPLVVTRRARTLFAKVREIIMARMTV